MSATWRSNNAFTLLEVLIALALLSLLAGAVYGSYFSLFRGREAAVAGMEQRRELRRTLDQLRRELDAIWWQPGQSPDPAKPGRLSFTVEDRDRYGKPAAVLSFTAFSLARKGTSDQIAIRYQLVEREGKTLLTREERDLYLLGEPARYPQMEEIEGFAVECLSGEKWVKSWNAELNRGLPRKIRVTITIKEGEGTADYSIIATPRITAS